MSRDFRVHVKDDLEMAQSMGRITVFWDNSVAEAFWSTLKRELVYPHPVRDPSPRQAGHLRMGGLVQPAPTALHAGPDLARTVGDAVPSESPPNKRPGGRTVTCPANGVTRSPCFPQF